MKNVSFYIVHNNSKDRIALRNRLKELANKLNINFFEIYKQRKNLKIKFSFKYKFTILRIYFLRIFYNHYTKNFHLIFLFNIKWFFKFKYIYH